MWAVSQWQSDLNVNIATNLNVRCRLIIFKNEPGLPRISSGISVTNLIMEQSDDNNNNIYSLQLGCHPVAVIILHVYKVWNWLLINLSREGYMRSM